MADEGPARLDAAALGTLDGPPVKVALVWEHHQPWYPPDEDGVVSQPWVRLRAVSDYHAEVRAVEAFPNVTVSFNVTPTLLRQLEQISSGTRDRHWTVTETNAAELTDEERRFLLQHFFDVHESALAGFSRLAELRQLRDDAGGPDAAPDTFETQDYLDLQVLFNLAWMDTSALAEEPLLLVAGKGSGFTEADKRLVLDEQLRMVEALVASYRELWDAGRVEIATAPLANPVLPLLADTDVASESGAGPVLPERRFQEIADADAQIGLGLDAVSDILGRAPTGMWPADGVVSTAVVPLIGRHGVGWIMAAESVAAGLDGAGLDGAGLDGAGLDGAGLDGAALEGAAGAQASTLLAPEYTGWSLGAGDTAELNVFFADEALSAMVDARARSEEGSAAADSLVAELRTLQTEYAASGSADPQRPPVVPILLEDRDGWIQDQHNERAFVRSLYAALSSSLVLETTTPTRYLEEFGVAGTLPGIQPAPDFSPWIGDREEARAWDYLARVRSDLDAAEARGDRGDDRIDAAFESMLYAEGADWFSWFGPDRTSTDDDYFDWAFRRLLSGVYESLGDEAPAFLDVPVIPAAPVRPAQVPGEPFTPTVDFAAGAAEWAEAGYHTGESALIDRVYYGYDRTNLYLRIDFVDEVLGNDDVGFEIYLGTGAETEARGTTLRGTLLGFDATSLVEWRGADPLTACLATELPPTGDDILVADCRPIDAGFDGDSIELSIPIRLVGDLEPGDRIPFRLVPNDVFRDTELFPASGPAEAQIPSAGIEDPAISVSDPRGDDHGPGTYVYPTGPEYESGAFDITALEVGEDGADYVFALEVAAPLTNPWGAPSGLSLQAFDFYIDSRPGGQPRLLAGRRAILDGGAWDVAVRIDGWGAELVVVDESGEAMVSSQGAAVGPDVGAVATVYADAGRVEVRVPRSLFGDARVGDLAVAAVVVPHDPDGRADGASAATIEIEESVDRFGGAPEDGNHTRVVDLAWAEPGVQEELLSAYLPVPADAVPPDGSLPRVPLNRPEPADS